MKDIWKIKVLVLNVFSQTEALEEKKALRRVPKGTSDYQAAWITNSDDEQDVNEDENEDDDELHEEMAEGIDSDHSMVMQYRFLCCFFVIITIFCFMFFPYEG